MLSLGGGPLPPAYWASPSEPPPPPLPHTYTNTLISHLGDEQLRGDLHSDAHEEETHEQSLVGGNVRLNLRGEAGGKVSEEQPIVGGDVRLNLRGGSQGR